MESTTTPVVPPPAGPGRPVGAIRILAVAAEGDPSPLHDVRQWAADAGMRCEYVTDLPRAARKLSAEPWDAVVTVIGGPPEEESLAWWVDALRGAVGTPRLIALVSRPSMGLVLRAERLGALELLKLPLRREEFQRAITRLRTAVAEVEIPLPAVDAEGPYTLVGQSAAMLEVYRQVARVAPSMATVLIQGGSGTGKEVVARAIHQHSSRASRPFVAVNCAAIPENLLESELFGHEKGSFTGAVARKVGRFELANGGTLFLDELADMSLPLQAKILRAIQEREIERVGGGDPIPVDVRIIAATNRDLRAAIQQGRFREDLFYRLAVVTIDLPRLSERGDDLLLLTSYFARQFAERSGKRIEAISDRALERLRAHDWVGNVRELKNAVERAVTTATDHVLRVENLAEEPGIDEPAPGERRLGGLSTLAEAEARHIARVLAHTGGQISAAAELLGIHRNTLARKIREYDL